MNQPSPPLKSTPKLSSLKWFTATFIALTTLLFIAMVAWNVWEARTAKLKETEIATANMAKALTQHAGDAIGGVDNILAGLVYELEARPLRATGRRHLQRFMRQRVAALPMLNGFYIYDEQGRYVANSQKTPLNNVNITDREYFIFHRAFADRGPHIGPSIHSHANGEWVLTVSRRFNHADGSFGGVVVATIKMTYFRSFYESFDIGNEGTILLLSDAGTLLIRRPFDDAVIGRDIRTGPVYRKYLEHGAPGNEILTSAIDKVTRLYSYRHLDGYPLLIVAALSKKEILANWRSETLRISIGSAFVVILLWLLGWYLLRQITISERAKAELGEAKKDLERINGELAALALQDSLTGLANRRRFDAALEAEYGRAIRNGISLALIMVDVDYFKKYNDTYGHLQGDDCLRKVCAAIRSASTRPADLVARYGGEEIAVLLPATDTLGAMVVAERIRLAVYNLFLAHTATPSGLVTVSAGVAAVVPLQKGASPHALIKAADSALYTAKAAGRNCVHAFRPEAQRLGIGG